MLADRMRMTAGDGLPTGAKHLMHFENNLYDEVQQTNATFTGGTPQYSTTDKKFGSYGMRTTTSTAISIPNSVYEFGTRDFTISFWLKTVTPSLERIELLNVATLGTPNKNILNLTKAGTNNVSISLTLEINGGTYSVTTGGNYVVGGNSFAFVKIGRKGTKLFLIVNGVEYATTLPVGYSIIANGTEPIRIGGTGGSNYLPPHDAWYDELLVQMDIGDDSLTIPTAPY